MRKTDTHTLSQMLKVAVLVGWSLWTTMAVATNVFDALRELGVLHDGWTLASGNFDFMRETTAIHNLPDWLNTLVFAGVIAWEGASAALLWRASLRLWQGATDALPAASLAFLVSLPLWLAFMFADEVFIAYGVQATHLRILTRPISSAEGGRSGRAHPRAGRQTDGSWRRSPASRWRG